MLRLRHALAFVAGLALAGCSSVMAPGGPGATRLTSIGAVYVDSHGSTLYTYADDAPGVSNCTNICAVIWPPVIAPVGAQPTGPFTLIKRSDGDLQWALHGHPLYTYSFDAGPGAVGGDGAEDGLWHAARP